MEEIAIDTRIDAPPAAVSEVLDDFGATLLAVMDAYVYEVSANYLAAMDARQTAEGMTYRHVARPDGGWDVIASRSTARRVIAASTGSPWAKIDGVWKVSNSTRTVEPDGCEELRPADHGMIRPPN